MRNSSKFTVLVTGGGGYIGTVLTETLLAAGYGVKVLDRFFSGTRSLIYRQMQNYV
jgi:nucleoside-diphosphate-sugar epimerase